MDATKNVSGDKLLEAPHFVFPTFSARFGDSRAFCTHLGLTLKFLDRI